MNENIYVRAKNMCKAIDTCYMWDKTEKKYLTVFRLYNGPEPLDKDLVFQEDMSEGCAHIYSKAHRLLDKMI